MPSPSLQRRIAARLLTCLVALSCSDDGSVAPALTTGEIRITVHMTGSALPPTYSVTVGGRSWIGQRGTAATVVGLVPGEHEVQLNVAASNCQVLSANPQRATVTRGRTTDVSFDVTCSSSQGTLLFVASTSGPDPDPNGYRVIVEASTVTGGAYHRMLSLSSTGQSRLEDVPVGNVRATLVGLAVNCDAAGANPRTVAVPSGQPITVAYDVSCSAATDQIAYVYEDGTSDLRLVSGDGTVHRSITSDVFHDSDPAWSPDGERLTFASTRDGNREIYRINPDGSNAVRLTDHPNDDFQPAWSPDGRRIAFTSNRSGNEDIFVVNADGTGTVQLTTHPSRDAFPTWSRDGRSIAFVSERGGRAEVYTMDAAGVGQTQVTFGGGRHPAWSPDGTTLAFSVPVCRGYGCWPSIFTKTGAQVSVLMPYEVAERPSWSPNGRRLVVDWFLCDFYYYDCNRDGIYIVTVDGTDLFRLTKGHSAVWRPR